jgi:hypothetical protein
LEKSVFCIRPWKTGIEFSAFFYPKTLLIMKNAATRPFHKEPSDVLLAPVIPIKSARAESKTIRIVSVKTEPDKTVPAFTEPVFKPKRHDMF